MQRALGLGSYVTAWTWLHKLRRAMARTGCDWLSGRVAVNVEDVGGDKRDRPKYQNKSKISVAIACEEDMSGVGRIRLRHL